MSHAKLTPREKEILRLICQGHSPKQIAPLVKLGDRRSVHNDLSSIKNKLGVETTPQAAVVFALIHRNQPWVRDLLYSRGIRHPWKTAA